MISDWFARAKALLSEQRHEAVADRNRADRKTVEERVWPNTIRERIKRLTSSYLEKIASGKRRGAAR